MKGLEPSASQLAGQAGPKAGPKACPSAAQQQHQTSSDKQDRALQHHHRHLGTGTVNAPRIVQP